MEKALDKVTETELQKFQPSGAIKTALQTASKMELKAPNHVAHGSGPWLDALGRAGVKFYTSRTGSTDTNNLVDQTIGFGNKARCYKEETILGDPKTMPSSRLTISNKTPLYDSSYRPQGGMHSGFWKAELSRKIKAGINMNAARVFYHPLPEAQLRRLRDPFYRTAPFTAVGSGNSTHFDPGNQTQKNSVYHPYRMLDKYIFTNLENLTNAKVSVSIIQLVTEKKDSTNDPKNCLEQIVDLIPVRFVPTEDGSGFTPPRQNYSKIDNLETFVLTQTGVTSDHKGFGRAHDSSWGGADFWTLKNYSVHSSKISEQMNVLKTSHQTLRPGETWQYDIESFVNRDLTQAGNVSQFTGPRDCINDSYHLMVTVHGASCVAYNARPSVDANKPWSIEDRKYMRCNSSATVGVRQIVEYEDFSFREPKDNNVSGDVSPAALFVKAYRAKPEADNIHRTIYCIPDNVVTEENEVTIPKAVNDKFLIPIATRADITATGIAKA